MLTNKGTPLIEFYLTVVLLMSFGATHAQFDRVEPPFWWVGMADTELQIMVHGDKVANLSPSLDYPNVEIIRTVATDNPNYLFLYLRIAPSAPPGTITIDFSDKAEGIKERITYELLARKNDSALRPGYDTSDVLYLITPDRFSNGEEANDNIPGLLEQADRTDKWGRHGGDIQGIENHLDYIEKMGFTAIWLNPILENDQKKQSYHGYSTTDFYRVDPRFGTNAEYRDLSKMAHSKGIKLIMDMIMNHCGSGHWWMEDLPSSDWINNRDDYAQTNHRRTTLRDPYTSRFDKMNFTDGWFVETMPDLNQRNPLLSDYLIQNTIWWIEYVGLSGIRMDTYPYSDKQFMAEWTCSIIQEYPNFNICGEEWSLNPAVLAYWQSGKENPDGYTSCLPGLLDFPLQNALVDALMEKEDWDKGMIKLYTMLSNDFLYADPKKHVIFPDNHDMSRIYTQLGEDYGLYRLAMVYFATMRGTPQFYYGTEILMSNKGDDSHGNIRSDFPGGWKMDAVNAFDGQGLTKKESEARSFVEQLLSWRKNAQVIHNGRLMHFVPREGTYVYFRYNDTEKVMVILNKSKNTELDLAPYAEMLENTTTGLEVLTGKQIVLKDKLRLIPEAPMIIQMD